MSVGGFSSSTVQHNYLRQVSINQRHQYFCLI